MGYLIDSLGQNVTLKIARVAEHGAYLVNDDAIEGDEVLLPNNQLDGSLNEGAEVDVFLYKDSEDRLIATREIPKVHLGEVALLKVTDVTKIGAFLDWGLKKDLFLPFKEQTKRVRPGDIALIALYIDKSERLCGTMHVYDYLRTDHTYAKNDHVHGRIYEITDSFGAFVAVEDCFSALIPHNEMNRILNVGDEIDARIKEIREDGKLTLSLSEKIKIQMGSDADRIYERLLSSDGTLPFHDKTSPEIIKREFGISKAAFKRALGRLKKESKIEIYNDHISINKS